MVGALFVFASYQHCFCVVKNRILCAICTNQAYKKRNINGTKLIATSCFKIQENLLAVNLMINALQSILKLDWDSLHAFEHQCALSFHSFFTLFFFSVSCLPQSYDVRMPSFFSHYWIPSL